MPAVLFISRATSYVDSLRVYRVILDGQLVGRLHASEMIRIPIRQGKHSLCVRVDWCGSRTVEFEAGESEDVSFECGSALVKWRAFLVLYYIIFRRDEYLWLEPKNA